MWSLGGVDSTWKKCKGWKKKLKQLHACVLAKGIQKKCCGQTVCRRMKRNSSSWNTGVFESISDWIWGWFWMNINDSLTVICRTISLRLSKKPHYMKVILAEHSDYVLLTIRTVLPKKQMVIFFNVCVPRTVWLLLLLTWLVVWSLLFNNNSASLP